MVTQRLNYPKHIVSVIGTCLESEPITLVLQYCNAQSLRSFILQRKASIVPPFTFGEKLTMCKHVVSACCYLEREGYVHRDIKTQNCMVVLKSMKSFLVKLGDFGLAKDVRGREKHEFLTDEPDFPIFYTAPEGFRGTFSIKSDVWSFGVLTWEVFSGKLDRIKSQITSS